MRRASGPSTIPIPPEDIFLTVNKLQQVAPPNKGRATLHYSLPVSLLPSKLPLLLPRQDCKGRIRSCGGSIFNENATFTATTGLPHNPGILSRQKSQAIGYGPLEDNCLKIDKLQQAAHPTKGGRLWIMRCKSVAYPPAQYRALWFLADSGVFRKFAVK